MRDEVHSNDHQGDGPDLHALVESALNHELTHDQASELNRILPGNEEACRHFIEMQLLNDRLAQMLGGEEVKNIVPFVEKVPVKRNYKRWVWSSAAAAAAVAMVAGIYFAFSTQPAFQVVQSTIKGSNYLRGQEVMEGTHLKFETGALQLRNEQGLDMVISGPADVEVLSSGEILVREASIYTKSGGDKLLIKTNSGDLRNLGTVYGVQQKKDGGTRLDVFEGSVQISQKDKDPVALAGGVAGVFASDKWPPLQEAADRSRYISSPHMGFAINFRHPQSQSISGEAPFNAQWVETTEHRGYIVPPGTGVGIEWLGSSLHIRPQLVPDELKPYASHLRCYLDNVTRDPLYGAMKLDAQKHGAGVRIRGLDGWYKRMGAKGYTLTVLRAGSRSDLEFLPVTLYAGMTTEAKLIGEFPVLESREVDLPDEQNMGGRIANQVIPQVLTNDEILLTLPPQSPNLSKPRANIAGVVVQPVFE